MKDTILLAHYYAPAVIRKRADFVGDSLDLAQKAQAANAKRIVFAGVRFMAETAKVLNPEAEVILPDAGSSCSLVDQTDIEELRDWLLMNSPGIERFGDTNAVHVAYINSSAEHKKLADWVVTSRNVIDIVQHLINQGKRVLFSPDRNMGAYLKYMYPDWDLKYWSAVCTVHDQFKDDEIRVILQRWTDGPKYLIAHPESPLPVLKRADFVGSTKQMLDWVLDRPITPKVIQHIYVATEAEMLDIMRVYRPDLDIQQGPGYTGCQCAVCPFMKKNTEEAVDAAMAGEGGLVIDYLDEPTIKQVRVPIDRMLDFQLNKLHENSTTS